MFTEIRLLDTCHFSLDVSGMSAMQVVKHGSSTATPSQFLSLTPEDNNDIFYLLACTHKVVCLLLFK